MKIKELKEELNKFPDDMEVVFHYYSDLDNLYDNDFVVYKKTLGHCSFKTSWKEMNEVYGNFISSFYKASVGYDKEKKQVIYQNVPVLEKNVVVLEVSER